MTMSNDTTTATTSEINLNSAILSLIGEQLAEDEGSSDFFYEDGEVIQQKWHVGFVLLAYFTAFMGSYSAIRLLEHGLWRSEREAQNATTISKYPKLSYAIVLGSCTIWSMHFIGMQAVVLENVDMCYAWLPTLMSLFLSVTGVWLGVTIASYDIFSGDDRVEVLKHLLRDNRLVTSKMNRTKASVQIHMVALFSKLHWIAGGSVLAALGALSMHYVGMIAMQGPFRREWSIPYVGGSVLVGCVVAFAGFWILFRPLHWKVEKSWYRQASAAVIALAVCCLHFLGMLSVTYIADSSQNVGECSRKDFQGWRPDQIKVLMVALAVPFISFFIEHTISNELRLTYRQLLDIRLTHSQFMDYKSRISGGGVSQYSQHSCAPTYNGSSGRGSVLVSRGFGASGSRNGRNVKISGLERNSEVESASLAGTHRRRISARSAKSTDSSSRLSERQKMYDMLIKCAEEVKAEQSAAMALDDDSSSGESAGEGRGLGGEKSGHCQFQPASTSIEIGNDESERDSQDDAVDDDVECSPSRIHDSPKTLSTLSTVTPSSEQCIDIEVGTGNDMEISNSSYLSNSQMDQRDQADIMVNPSDDSEDPLERFRRRDSLSLQDVLDDVSGSSLTNSHSTRQGSPPSRRRGLERRYQSAGNILELDHPTTGDDDGATSSCLHSFTPKPNPLQAFCNAWSPPPSRKSLPPDLNQLEPHRIATESA